MRLRDHLRMLAILVVLAVVMMTGLVFIVFGSLALPLPEFVRLIITAMTSVVFVFAVTKIFGDFV